MLSGMARVLLVDDEKLLALLQDYLVEEGFKVRVESESARGIAQALSGDYALVVLDVMMPRLNGLEALRRPTLFEWCARRPHPTHRSEPAHRAGGSGRVNNCKFRASHGRPGSPRCLPRF